MSSPVVSCRYVTLQQIFFSVVNALGRHNRPDRPLIQQKMGREEGGAFRVANKREHQRVRPTGGLI